MRAALGKLDIATSLSTAGIAFVVASVAIHVGDKIADALAWIGAALAALSVVALGLWFYFGPFGSAYRRSMAEQIAEEERAARSGIGR